MMRLIEIIIRNGLSDIEHNSNPYGIARNLLSIIVEYRTYDNIYDETKAGFPRADGRLETKLFLAGHHNRKSLIDYYCNQHGHEYYKNGLEGAANGGHLDLVKYCINKGGKYGSAIWQAHLNKHQDVIDYLTDPCVDYNTTAE